MEDPVLKFLFGQCGEDVANISCDVRNSGERSRRSTRANNIEFTINKVESKMRRIWSTYRNC